MGVFVSCDNSHTGVTSSHRAQPPARPSSNTPTSKQTPLFPSSFTTGTENRKCEQKNRLFCAPHPPSPKHAGYLQAEASGSVAAAALAAGRLLADAALGAVAAAHRAAGAAACGGDTRVRGGVGRGGGPTGQEQPVESGTPPSLHAQGSDPSVAVAGDLHRGPMRQGLPSQRGAGEERRIPMRVLRARGIPPKGSGGSPGGTGRGRDPMMVLRGRGTPPKGEQGVSRRQGKRKGSP